MKRENRIKRTRFFLHLASSIGGFNGDTHRKELDNEPFFILGSGRNGSTLLASTLNNNPHLFIPPEEYLLPFEIVRWRYVGRWMPSNFLRNMINRFITKPTKPRWAVEHVDRTSVMENWSSGSRSFIRLFDLLVRYYAQSTGKDIKVWGDKTPLLTHYIDVIYPVFSKSKYIILIRDPRDVALSYLKMHSNSETELLFGMWRWNDSIRTLDYLTERNAHILLIKYENLVSAPEDTLDEVHRFLDVESPDDIVYQERSSTLMDVDTLSHLKNISKPIDTSSIGKWKNELDERYLRLILPIITKGMERFGYDKD